ncbi:MAG: transcription antitermination factor NusB [Bacteroidales bacterium]
MLNRRFVREKTVQALYAFYQGGSENAVTCENNMLAGLQKTYELYICQFSFIVALSEYFNEKFSIGKQKFVPSDSDLNPNTRFPDNLAILHIRNSPIFQLKNESYKFNWESKKDILKSVYNDIIRSTIYEEYISSKETPTFTADQDFLCKIFKKKIANNSAFHAFCEEQSIFWICDFDSVSHWVSLSIKGMKENESECLEPAFSKEDEDIQFAKTLLQKTLLHDNEYQKLIFERLENWDADRVAMIELIILKAALTELINFPSIPIKVSLNEYIEVSKRFCSEKSRIFVNGLLNKLASDLTESKIIKKSGRGLI